MHATKEIDKMDTVDTVTTVAAIERDSMPQPIGALRAFAERLDQVEAALQGLPALPETQAALAWTQSLGKTGHWLATTVGTNGARRYNGFAMALNAELRTLQEMPIAPNERRMRQAESIQRTKDEAAKRTVEAYAVQGQQLANEVVNAMHCAKVALDGALTKASGPLSLSGPLDVNFAVAVAALKEEICTKSPSAWKALLKSIIDRNETQQERIAMMALSPLADAVMAGSPPTLAKMYGPLDASVIRRLRTEAADFQVFVAARRESLIPAHLGTLRTVLTFLDGAFLYLLGPSPSWMDSAEFHTVWVNVSTLPDTSAVYPLWIERYIRSVLVRA
jgi:predicted secreted protein